MKTSSNNAGIPRSPLFTAEIKDEEYGIEAYICIHSMGKYGASGGMRCLPDVTKEEVKLLAEAMTYKYSFWNIQSGGAKAGLIINFDESAAAKHKKLQMVAKHAEPLIKKNIWSPWSDMNFYGEDLSMFYSGIGINMKPSNKGSSKRTAISAFGALQSFIEHNNLPPADVKIAIEGFGSVAKHLVESILAYGPKVVALSNHLGAIYNPAGLDLKKIFTLENTNPLQWVQGEGEWDKIEHNQLFEVDCDILMPGARVHAISEKIAENIKAKVLIPFANVPCTEKALENLDKRGVLFVPDYIVNGGGVCGHILGGSNPCSDDKIRLFYNSFKPMMKRLLKAGQSQGVPLKALTDMIAHENFKNITSETYRHLSLGQKVIRRLGRTQFLKSFLDADDRKKMTNQTIAFLDKLFVS